MQQSIRARIVHSVGVLSTIFLNGLFALLPITLTFAIFRVSFRLLKGWVEPVHDIMPNFLKRIPESEFVLIILFIFLMGIMMRTFFLRTIIHALENLLSKVPLIRPIYRGIKQLVHAFNPQDTLSFKKVVLVEFPRKGLYSVGFVTSEVSPELAPEKTKSFVTVFVPTTPNPTTGFFMVLPEDEMIVIDLSRQEAMALIISGGIIQPERFKKQ